MSKVLVVGLPRSGTSWIGNALGRAPHTVYVHEPDGDHDPFAFRARRSSFITPTLAPGDPAPELERLWRGAFAGGQRPLTVRSRIAWRRYRLSPVEQRWDAWLEGRVSPGLKVISALAVPREATTGNRHVVAKSVRAEWNVEWIVDRFGPEVVVVERHPLNVLASWSELGFGKDGRAIPGLGRVALRRWGLVAPAVDAPLIERQAFVYGIGATALHEAAERNPRWLRVRHEQLCLDPVPSMRTLVGRIGLEWGSQTEQYLAESDREGSGYHTQRKAEEQPERWRTRLTPEHVETILATLARFPAPLIPS
ncbi:MAG: hypothetical protein ABJC79_14070 [Acidimicrobiia bacterium]